MIEKIHEPKGVTVLGDFKNCKRLKDVAFLEDTCLAAINIADAHIEEFSIVRFDKAGLSLNYTLSESHLNMHTWPEKDTCYVDFFTCGAKCKPEEGMCFIKNALSAEGSIRVIERNVEKNESLEICLDQVSLSEMLD